MERTRKMILASLLAALTCVATMIIKLPTPTMGYIHPGDGFVLLCGLILGPLWGGFAAGLGSALSDFFSGYIIYVPGTFIIKALCAFTAGCLFNRFKLLLFKKPVYISLVIAGSIGETIMVVGYFLYEILILAENFSPSGLKAATLASLAGVPANIIQAIFGIITAALLFPVLSRFSHK